LIAKHSSDKIIQKSLINPHVDDGEWWTGRELSTVNTLVPTH